jgi:hypothetical protein
MAYKVVAAFYESRGGRVIKPGKDLYTPPSDSFAQKLVDARCLKRVDEPAIEQPQAPEVEVQRRPRRRARRVENE